MSKHGQKINNPAEKDFFKLPFEVFFRSEIDIFSMEFKITKKPKSFTDIKGIKLEQGYASKTSFYCPVNNGPELYCCLVHGHDEVAPPWLWVGDNDEGEQYYNCGRGYRVVVDGDQVSFADFDDYEDDELEDIDDLDVLSGFAFEAYLLSYVKPDYFILDALDSRVKINADGYIFDENDQLTKERLFVPSELNVDELKGFTTRKFADEVNEWISTTLRKKFPKDKLTISIDGLL